MTIEQTWCPDAARYDRGECGWPRCGCPGNGPKDAEVKSNPQSETSRTVAEIDEEVDDLLRQASEEAAESHDIAPNSYGAGYDAGYRDALRRALCIVRDLDGLEGLA